MTVKFGRNYKLVLEGLDGKELTIEPPFTVEFDVVRKNFASVNDASFRIYNLSKNNRQQLQKNEFDMGLIRKISFLAGYGKNLAILFSGNIKEMSSVRQGVDFITHIVGQDGGSAYGNAQINKNFPSGTPYKNIVTEMIKTLAPFNIGVGAIGSISGSTGRGAVFEGGTIDILKQLTNDAFFIDTGLANVLSDDEVIDGEIIVIDPSSGLLGTPKLESGFLVFDSLFEPRIQVGTKLRLQSTTGQDKFNGDYKVSGVSHKGIISEVTSGVATTSVSCVFGGQFTSVKQAQGLL